MSVRRFFDEAYFKIDNDAYYGYTATVEADNAYYLMKLKAPGIILTNREVTELFSEINIDNRLDQNFKPNSGDPLHIVPDCKYSIADIRNNYQIKRDFDAGVYNVFSPLEYPRSSFWVERTVVIPSKKHIVLLTDCTSNENAFYVAKSIFQDLRAEDCIFYGSHMPLIGTKKLRPYLPLLLGTAKKPCISYKKLEFNTNELTSDVLMLVKKCGGVDKCCPDAEKNFLIQLAVLNQHNWRDYPRTIMNMFSTFGYGTIKEEVFNHPSKYPKYVNEMYNMTRATRPVYTEKDFNLSREFYANVLDIKSDTMFVDTLALQHKLNNVGISLYDFEQIFNLTTRITPRKYDQE